MNQRVLLSGLAVALVGLTALALVMATAMNVPAAAQEDIDPTAAQATVDAAVQELFIGTATAQAAYQATATAEAENALPMTATVQAAFDTAVQATAAAVEFASVVLTPPGDASAADYFYTEEGDPAIGNPDALVTLVEYSDFTCPYCSRFQAETLPRLLEEYGEQIRFVYRDFPILSDFSVASAIAAECADDQARFWEYHDWLFANQGNLDVLGLRAIAYNMGMDMPAFEQCLFSDVTIPELQDDFNAARALGATGTPAFEINGEFIAGAQPYEVFQQAIENALAVASGEPLPPTLTPDGPQPVIVPLEELPQWEAPPEMALDPDMQYTATFVTAKGDIVVDLFASEAPETVNNFVFLAREGFYDNTTFHRVIDGFMAQGGDPSGTGRGGPGYTFGDETDNGLVFDRAGLLAMANAGPGTNGSQFFITFGPAEWLNGLHTIFGEVVQGQAVLDSLTRRDPEQNPNYLGDTLITVEITETRAEE